MTEKILGYVLLVAGIIAISLSGVNVYQVFSKRIKPVQFFDFKGISLDTSQIIANSLPPEAALMMQQGNTKAVPTEIIPGDILNDSSNLFAHLMLMGFIASLGFKVGQLGTYLMRPIEVKVKGQLEPVKTTG